MNRTIDYVYWLIAGWFAIWHENAMINNTVVEEQNNAIRVFRQAQERDHLVLLVVHAVRDQSQRSDKLELFDPL
jgi:hypothetical protein